VALVANCRDRASLSSFDTAVPDRFGIFLAIGSIHHGLDVAKDLTA
jgi:hypothetical protein